MATGVAGPRTYRRWTGAWYSSPSNAAEVCGYARCNEDPGFGLHVIDLLVAQPRRGQRVGRLLLETVAGQFSHMPTYAHSDVDPYYAKQGYRRVGSLFQVSPGGHRG